MTRKWQPTDPAAGRPLRFRMRSDLEIASQQVAGERYWLVKDPVALQYFQLRDAEYAILCMLDGRTTTAEEIRQHFNRRFAPQQLDTDFLHGLLVRMHRAGLLISEAVDQGTSLLTRRGNRRRDELLQRASNVLAVRFRGFDPDRLLGLLYPWVRPLFSRGFLVGAALLALAAVLLVFVRFDQVSARLPELRALLTVRNTIALACTLAVVKVLHELGHGLACKHFGGQCHEMGFMLLVFTPCLYCNVSDAWMFPRRTQRIAVSAAGMIVEIVLAATCTFLWWLSEPGLFNTLCLNVMLIGSIGTLLINGNPLMRYDGYYILSDLWQVPNLAQQSQAAFRYYVGRIAFGTSAAPGPDVPVRCRRLLALYALAAILYRLFLVGAILWAFHHFLAAWHLEIVVVLLALAVAIGMAVPPIVWLVRRTAQPGSGRQFSPWRTLITMLIAALLVVGVLLVPVPTWVTAPAVLQYADAQNVYVSVDGTLREALPVGERVEAGQTVATLENLSVRRDIARLAAATKVQENLLSHLEARRGQDPEAAGQIPTARQQLDGLRRQLVQLQQDEEDLILTAPVSGTVLPVPSRSEKHQPASQLSDWHGTPLDPTNRGCFLQRGTPVCLVGNAGQLQAMAMIDQSDVERIRLGQPVRLQLDQSPGRVLHGTVQEVAQLDLEIAPRELAATRQVPVEADSQQQPRLSSTTYQARIVLDDAPAYLLNGSVGRAKIEVTRLTLGEQLARYLAQTFRFRL